MTSRKGFVLLEALIAITLFSLLAFQLTRTSMTSSRYINQSLDAQRGSMAANDVLETLMVEFQAAESIRGCVGIDSAEYAQVPEREISIKRISLIQYKRVPNTEIEHKGIAKAKLKEFEQVITIYPNEERKPLTLFHRESATSSIGRGYEAATGVEEIRIAQIGDDAYQLSVTVKEGSVQVKESRIVVLGKKRES